MPASVSRWEVIEQLFARALELPKSRRHEFLVSACPDDEEVRREVRGLLAAHEAILVQEGREGGRFLEQLDVEGAAALIESGTGTDLIERLQRALGSAYRVERELDGAGMSRVFVAEQLELGRRVVVKVVPPDVAGAVSVERFQREVRLAARLQHPHIVPVFSAGETDGIPFYTMPYVDGESLRARIARDGSIPVDEAISILRDVAKALEFAHGRGIVHRDIKPGNVLLAGNSALVTDFGIAKAVQVAREKSEAEPDLGSTGAIAPSSFATRSVVTGTPGYMAPEQAAGESTLDHRVDIYAFGCLAYEVVTGVPPFQYHTAAELIVAHRSETPDMPRVRRAGAPKGFEALVGRCLEKEPDRRPQSATAILRTLDGVRRRPLLSRRIAAVVGATLLGLVAIVGAFVTRGGSLTTSSPESVRDARPSIAVLPFVNATRDPRDEYFADGLTEELITALAVPGLRVMSRSASFAFKGRPVTARQVGESLGVTSVLEGQVRRTGNRLRLIAQLVDVSDGSTLWSKRYEREMPDVFDVQNEMVQSIASELKVAYDRGASRLASGGTSNLVAHDLYLRGLFESNRRTKAGVERGIQFLTQAISRDSGYALAHLGLAEAHVLSSEYASVPAKVANVSAEQAALQALRIDSTLGEAHATLGSVYASRYNWREAENHFIRAIALRPDYARAYHWYSSNLLRPMRRFDSAEVVIRRAQELDPSSPSILTNFALIWAAKGEYKRAIGHMNMVVNRFMDVPRLRRVLAVAYALDGQYQRAETEFRIADATRGDAHGLELAWLYGLMGRRARADSILRAARARPASAAAPLVPLAEAYAAVGDKDRAFEALNMAVQREQASWIAERPQLASLRSDQRFAALLKRVGLDGTAAQR